MAKILISLLGTGKIAKGDNTKNEYVTTDYKIDQKFYQNKTLVSSALIEHHQIDTIFFVGTKQSMWDNICTLFEADEDFSLSILDKKENNILTEDDMHNISKTINTKLNSSNSKCFMIEDSESQEQLWAMFDKFLEILSTINKNDEVHFDITHLFRSVSVLSMIMAEFGKINYDIKISGMYYGLLKKGEPSVIVNLSVFFELLDWARAISNLKNYGNSFELMRLIEKSDEDTKLKNSFSDFSNALSISDIGALQQSIKHLKGKLEIFQRSNNNIIKLISKDLTSFIKRFDIESIAKFQFEFAKWYMENQNYAFAYITLVEAVISGICEQEDGLDPVTKDSRDEAKRIILQDYKYNHSKKLIYETYHRVNNIRVNIAHVTPPSGSKSKSYPKDSIANLPKYIERLSSIFK